MHKPLMHRLLKFLPVLAAMMAGSCSSGNSKTTENVGESPKPTYAFDSDSAYSFVAQQVAFGPRVPGSQAAKECADWLVAKLKQFNADSIVTQQAVLTAYNGDKLDIRNITAQYNPSSSDRILLLAHWDTRPWADQESDRALRDKPIDGANDGASGVAVILELCRNFAQKPPRYGVDILFVDAEDYGRRSDEPSNADDNTWALGTQYWLEHPTLDLKQIRYAILLDMVGGKNALFPREYHSQYACAAINDIVWRAARQAGQSERFPDKLGGAIVDDHVYFIMAGIPAIDIIESNNPTTGSFPPTWHTHSDNLENIDRNSLNAVGRTLEQLLR